MSHQSLKGKVSLVTGASRGIGKAIAAELAAAGSDVAVNYVSPSSEDKARQVADKLVQMGVRAKAYRADVSDIAQADGMIADIVRDFGRVDVLVNNAAINRDKTFMKLPREQWDEVVRVNLGGAYNLIHTLLPSMVETGWGRIISIVSVVAQMGNFGQTNYSASKGAVMAFTKSLAREVGRKNVTVNCVAPGYIETDMTAGVPEKVIHHVKDITPIGRLGSPEEVAFAVRFLADPRASYITGQVVAVNGGMYM
ncbi:MAG: beta-ketoacyl-ACP reductase [Phycisphaerae bacterium]|nr:MAG: beta-ketoacyl-ACP reductase [Planctomycetota bacterium]KAB2949640.1 MAG: beta-ketoacyl-ACP reductase [Phycisphaerae bacterium]MBE7456257.1 beta-ketoacyl-ACP reductase [Planctomycetia bacterium]MCK6464806.1 beta-ketoacyl-ACP reductase [Phycisphaerae bacterium]MCL4718376.1 beta-ketoacyl-ACP reductase [Phycisphaerae bacterium]